MKIKNFRKKLKMLDQVNVEVEKRSQSLKSENDPHSGRQQNGSHRSNMAYIKSETIKIVEDIEQNDYPKIVSQ